MIRRELDLTESPNPLKISVGGKEEYIFSYYGDGIVSQDIQFDLVKAGSEVKVLGLILGLKDAKIDLNVQVNHLVPNTKCTVLVKAVLKDKSKLDFFGKLFVSKGAHGSDSFLDQRTLLLGDGAGVDSTPQLEILANNVKCSHKVSMSKPSVDEIFYMSSRGLFRDNAVELISKGFLAYE